MKKINLLAMVVFVVVAICSVVFIGLDYKRYAGHKNSTLFGSKDVYEQGQSLYFDELKVTIKKVKHKRYDFQTSASCFKISEQAGALMRSNGFIETPEWQVLSMRSSRCLDAADSYENKKMLEVYYNVENIGDKPLDISKYDIKVVGDEKAEETKPYTKISTLLAGQSRENSFTIHDMRLKRDGPFALIVKKDDIQKQILLNLPKIQPFCDRDQCSVEVFDRQY